MNSLQRELQTLTEQIEEQDDLLRPLEKEVEKAEKKAAKECERDDATMLGKEIWKELDGVSDDLQKCRASATTALRAASRQVSTKRLRVRLRLSGRIVKEPKQIHVVTSKGQRAAVEAIVQAGTNLAMARVGGIAEFWLDKPVIAINTATYWHALRMNGIEDKIQGYGSLLSHH